MRILMVSALLLALALSGCSRNKAEQESYGPGEIDKWQDPNFKIIGIGAYNYTDYDIGTVFLLPPDKNDIDYASRGHGQRATRRDETDWEGGYGMGASLAWDFRWKAPRKFKVWWVRVVDMNLYRKSGPYPKDGGMYDPYDPYTTKQTQPGLAWCESEIEVKEQFGELFGPPFPHRKRDQLVLYFYPNGTVQGHVEFAADSDIKIEDIAKRDELPKLIDRPCLKEVSNPFYGKKRPISIN